MRIEYLSKLKAEEGGCEHCP